MRSTRHSTLMVTGPSSLGTGRHQSKVFPNRPAEPLTRIPALERAPPPTTTDVSCTTCSCFGVIYNSSSLSCQSFAETGRHLKNRLGHAIFSSDRTKSVLKIAQEGVGAKRKERSNEGGRSAAESDHDSGSAGSGKS